MKYPIPLILCLILLFSPADGQNSKPGKENEVDNKVVYMVDSLNELAFKTKRFNLNRSLSILVTASTLATENNYKKGLATSLLYEAGIYQQNGFDKKALSGFTRSLEISRSIADTFNIARANQQIATALQASGKVKEAEIIYNQAMTDYKRLKKDDEVVNTKNSLGSIDLQQKDFVSAHNLFKEALDLSRKINYKYGEKKSLYYLGLLNREKGDWDEAARLLNASLVLDEQMHDRYGMALGNIELAFIANHKAKFDEAIKFSEHAFDYASSIDAYQLVSKAIENIIYAYRKKNDLTKIIEWQDKLIKTEKGISDQEKNYAINFIDILKEQQDKQMKVEKKAVEVSQQSVWKNILFFIVIIALITLSALAYLWFKNYKRAETFSTELADKNLLIEKHSLSLDLLNKAISKQNFRLEESNQMKDKLLSIISHDLRHPLVNTKGILELVNLNLVNPEETKDLLGQLESQYLRSLTLLDNLLFWIRGQMKGEMIDKGRINLWQLMEDLIEDHKIPLQNKRITARNNVQDNLSVFGDKEMLKIIFRNLLSNAIKFTPQEGEIEVYSSSDKSPAIHIKDSGVGMDSETLHKVNAKQYFTTRGTGNESGSGFGLMLCHDLIEKHNGVLTVKSEPGRGSTFTVELPPSPVVIKEAANEEYQQANLSR